VAQLRPDRYIECATGLGFELYERVATLPLVSPHGHVDVRLFADPDARLDPPGRLFVTADHYVVRMLYSQGVPLEQLGYGDAEDRAVFATLIQHLHLFDLTPSGLWLRETLDNVFGSDDYDRIEEQLASPAFAPRALLDRFQIEVLATTDPAESTLTAHEGLAPRIRPTFRPDTVAALDSPSWRDSLNALDSSIEDYRDFVDALAARRAAFKAAGATATDHAATSADTTRLSEAEAAGIFAVALRDTVNASDARRFEAHMLNEFARMSTDDGLVMQLHIGSLRDHDAPLAARFGRDLGADIPVATDWTRGLRPLLDAYGSDPAFRLILYTLDESTYSRELAPLAGHYPAVLLGCPWWFHDSPSGIDRYLERVVETAGIANLAGFVDDARALTTLPARHDLWRRRTCGWLACKVEAGLLAEDDAHRIAHELAYDLAKRAYRLD
jgi:glucuronate isomerase